VARKPNLLKYQRENRKNPTPAEDKLWQAVRNNKLGVRFLRQKQFDWYIADFYCTSAQLVIEVDGGIHATSQAIAYDAERTKVLEARGLKVVRFKMNRC
jgi:very-short-patch-repair endonuclease